jgi:predicted signal transduction protein with EAL and GGDEF domain
MKRLPLSLILLIWFLAFFYNLERLNIGAQNLININSFVYVLVTLAVIFTIMLHVLRRLNAAWVLILWNIAYIFIKVFVYSGKPYWGGIDTFITIVEITMLSVSVLLAHWAGMNLDDFEKAVENITFAEIKRASNLKDATESINSEIYRSRRYNHPWTMIMVEPLKGSQEMILNQSVREVQESMISRYVSISLARALRDYIRRTDMLVEQPEKGRFIVITPETGKVESNRVVSKIFEAAKSIGAEVAVGVCAFPDDALTLEDMLSRAEIDLAEKEIGKREQNPDGQEPKLIEE